MFPVLKKSDETIRAVQALRREYFLCRRSLLWYVQRSFPTGKPDVLDPGYPAAETGGIPCRLILVGEGEQFERTKSLAVRLSVRKEVRFRLHA